MRASSLIPRLALRTAITGSTGSMSRPSHYRLPVKPSGTFPKVCRKNFSRLCLISSGGKPKLAWRGSCARARQCGMAWPSYCNLKIPDGIRLICLPPYIPELQPAETLWALVDEPIVNKYITTIEGLGAKIAGQCVALAEQREQSQTRTGLHWWPKPINPNYCNHSGTV